MLSKQNMIDARKYAIDSSRCMDHNTVIWTHFKKLIQCTVFLPYCTYDAAEPNIISFQDIAKTFF
jgi:hypothetical protein